MVIVLMGVSGSGKSTIGSLLAQRLGCEFADADRFHPPENIEKMHAGIALGDADRWPWLAAIAAFIDETRAAGRSAVVACSALKRAYREVIIADRPHVALVYLKGPQELIAQRIAHRHGHFMPASLLSSQFATLEEPQADERPITVSIAPDAPEIVERILKELDRGATGPRPPEPTSAKPS